MPISIQTARHIALIAVCAMALALPSLAETAKPMTMDMSRTDAASPSTTAYQAAMNDMITDMMIPCSRRF